MMGAGSNATQLSDATLDRRVYETSVQPAVPEKLAEPGFKASSSASWTTIASISWVVGATFLLLRIVFVTVTTRRFIRECDPMAELPTAAVERALRSSSLTRTPEIRVSSSAAAPFAAGIFRPVVVLPNSVVSSLSVMELQLILTHEFGHVAGRDVLWATLATIVRSLLWFHPLAWRVPAAQQLACETVCDSLAT